MELVTAGRIAVLSSDVVDQIAAGEVVDRPASVVKELVDNAIDAGATRITVEIERGGKDRIRVVDDGYGMTAEEAMLALRRHATSKLRSIDDLFGIGTMGFRGEALAAICAVSKVTVITRPEGGEGIRIDIEGGRVIRREQVGAPVGTSIEVRELMFNVPARQKFLKGDATESAHVGDVVSKAALAHPHIHVRMVSGKRTTLNATRCAEPLDRVREILGSRLARNMHCASAVERGIQVTAYLAPPEIAQTTSRGLQLFVGKRPIKDRGLLHAVAIGYGELVPKGRYPVAVVFVDVPGEDVDVNVHPQKQEVRFSDAQLVYAAVRHTVSRGVGEAHWVDGAEPSVTSTVRVEPWTGNARPASAMARDYAARATQNLFGYRPTQNSTRAGGASERGVGGSAAWSAAVDRARSVMPVEPAEQPTTEPGPAAQPATEAHRTGGQTGEPSSVSSEGGPDDGAGGFFGALRYVGQLDRTYLVCEGAGELILIDQHAAHERVAFQRLHAQHTERALPVQRLLFPRAVNLDKAATALVSESKEALARLGFDVLVTDAKIELAAVPAALPSESAAAVFEKLASEIADHGVSKAVEERLDNILATIACHSVVRAGDTLSPQEAQALLDSLDGLDFRGYCPHGRPVVLRMAVSDIARKFGRS